MIVKISNECVMCGACEAINSDIFKIDIRPTVNQKMVAGSEQDCIDAALICPVNAIWIDEIF